MIQNTMNKKWIYLKSNNITDALALATVLSYTSEQFNIVRRAYYTEILKSLPNVNISFYTPSEGSSLITIQASSNLCFKEICASYFNLLGINIPENYKCYDGFLKHNEQISRILEESSYGLFYILPDNQIDLFFYDNIARVYEQHNVKFISGGTLMLPCIKGTIDLRDLLSIPTLFSIKHNIKFLITNVHDIANACKAYDIQAYEITMDEHIKIESQIVNNPQEIVNFISISNN